MDPFTGFAIAKGAETILGIFGGNEQARAQQKAADNQAKQAKEMADYSWEERKRIESKNQHDVDIARLNERSVREFTDMMNWDKYSRDLYIKDFDYKKRVEQYNASELAYAQQIDFNAMGARLAREEQITWLDEQLQQAAFQAEELAMTTQNQYNIQAHQLGKAKDTFDVIRANTNLKHRSKSAEFAGKSIEGMVKTLQAKGESRARGQAGRSARKTVQAIGAIADFQQSMLNDMATKSEQAFANEQEQNQMQYQHVRARTKIEKAFTAKQYEFGQRQVQATRDSAFKANKANMLRIEYDQYGADMAAESNRQAPPPAYEDLPEVAAPYFTPQTHIPDAYRTKKKPPGPTGAPNLMAGQGLIMAGQVMGSAASAASAYAKMNPKQTPIENLGGGDRSYPQFTQPTSASETYSY